VQLIVFHVIYLLKLNLCRLHII